MAYKVDNAIIMAAGLSSRFAPISYEKPKALIEVKGEVLIERQIRQLQEAGIDNIILVVGYKKEHFYYLEDKFRIKIVENKEYTVRNNNSSIWAVRGYLNNSYICSADNYFSINPFESEVEESYYSVLFTEGKTGEWCVEYDEEGWITDVTIGGENAWYMLGHVFWSEEFSHKFVTLLEEIYDHTDTKDKLWEAIYMEHLDELKLKVRKYKDADIYEFDSLDELREFDEIYKTNSGSVLMKECANRLRCEEREFLNILPIKGAKGTVCGFQFDYKNVTYCYLYETKEVMEVEKWYE